MLQSCMYRFGELPDEQALRVWEPGHRVWLAYLGLEKSEELRKMENTMCLSKCLRLCQHL